MDTRPVRVCGRPVQLNSLGGGSGVERAGGRSVRKHSWRRGQRDPHRRGTGTLRSRVTTYMYILVNHNAPALALLADDVHRP